jgi:transposase-like protein
MTKKLRKKIPKEIKLKSVQEYLSGTRSAKEIADTLGLDAQVIYRWKTLFEEKSKGVRAHELEDNGCPPEMAKRMTQLEDEITEYQKKVAEQLLIIDILKKLRQQGILPSESELSGLIAITKQSDLSKRPAK